MRERLGQFAIFQGMSADELNAVGTLCRTVGVGQGERVFQAGAPATSLFLVSAGELELRFTIQYYSAPTEILLQRNGEGSVLGWSAVTSPYRYTLSAYATKDSELIAISQTNIQDLCEANPHLGYVLMKNTAQIIARRFQALQAVLAKEIQHRLQREDTLA